MNAYELTLIIRPDLDEEHTRDVAEQVHTRLQAAGAEIIAMYPWSPPRRRMAYPIKNFGDGFYVTLTFRLDPQAIREVENALRLNERLLRFLNVQATDQAIRQSENRVQQQAAAAAAAAAPPPAPTPEGAQLGTSELPETSVPGGEQSFEPTGEPSVGTIGPAVDAVQSATFEPEPQPAGVASTPEPTTPQE